MEGSRTPSIYNNHDFASISVNGDKWRAAERALSKYAR
jgi:hypothetical protein